MENSHDLEIVKDDDMMDSSKKLNVIKREDIVIGDLEEMELTSRSYKIKGKKIKKFCNDYLITIFLLIAIIYLSVLYLFPFLSNSSSVNIRTMSQHNGIFSINQNYERLDPNDKKYV